AAVALLPSLRRLTRPPAHEPADIRTADFRELRIVEFGREEVADPSERAAVAGLRAGRQHGQLLALVFVDQGGEPDVARLAPAAALRALLVLRAELGRVVLRVRQRVGLDRLIDALAADAEPDAEGRRAALFDVAEPARAPRLLLSGFLRPL